MATMDEDRRVWGQMLGYLRAHHPLTCRQWFEDIEPLGVRNGTMRLRAHSRLHRDYLQRECIQQFREGAQAVTGHLLSVQFLGPDDVSEVLDPDNPEHVELGFAELDQALAAGAEMIGLDAYTAMGPADAYRWLQMMQERAPGVRFMIEVSTCDIFHNLAASWVFAEDLQTAHVLADFLHPGHPRAPVKPAVPALPRRRRPHIGYQTPSLTLPDRPQPF